MNRYYKHDTFLNGWRRSYWPIFIECLPSGTRHKYMYRDREVLHTDVPVPLPDNYQFLIDWANSIDKEMLK